MLNIWTQHPPFLPIFAASLCHHVVWSNSPGLVLLDTTISLCLAIIFRSPFLVWRHAVKFARLWTTIPGIESVVPVWIIRGGPLGKGCGKVLEILTGCFLWRIAYPTDALPITLGPMPSGLTFLIVLGLAGATNLVLSVWSSKTRSRGNHSGVDAMVKSTRGKDLTFVANMHLVLWATTNAICEEISSRGLWMAELQLRGDLSLTHANFLQAISFGVWHYHGIPSGWAGVGLTFVYGMIMGTLSIQGQGLLLPIIAHTIADYFIFAVIARRGGF